MVEVIKNESATLSLVDAAACQADSLQEEEEVKVMPKKVSLRKKKVKGMKMFSICATESK